MRTIRFIASIILSLLAWELIKTLKELILQKTKGVPCFIEEFTKYLFNIFSKGGDWIGFMN